MIKSIEINSYHVDDEGLFCMFCGKQIICLESPVALDEEPPSCPHVLFIYNQEAGYEYKSNFANKVLPTDEQGDEDIPDLIKQTKGLPSDSFIIEITWPSPSFTYLMIGFSSYTE